MHRIWGHPPHNSAAGGFTIHSVCVNIQELGAGSGGNFPCDDFSFREIWVSPPKLFSQNPSNQVESDTRFWPGCSRLTAHWGFEWPEVWPQSLLSNNSHHDMAALLTTHWTLLPDLFYDNLSLWVRIWRQTRGLFCCLRIIFQSRTKLSPVCHLKLYFLNWMQALLMSSQRHLKDVGRIWNVSGCLCTCVCVCVHCSSNTDVLPNVCPNRRLSQPGGVERK